MLRFQWMKSLQYFGSVHANVHNHFSSESHKYEAAPAKYLAAPNASSGDPAAGFEIGRDGKVQMPELAYVGECA